MGRRIRHGVAEGHVLDLLGKNFDGLLKVPDHVVVGSARFILPGSDLLPQVHHLVTHLLYKVLVLLSVRGHDGLRHGVFDLSFDQGGGV